MGISTPKSQQSSKVALRATSKPIHRCNSMNKLKSSSIYSRRRGNLLGDLRPYWIKVKESEQRLRWLKQMVKLDLVVRDIDAYAKAVSEKLRSDEMKFLSLIHI